MQKDDFIKLKLKFAQADLQGKIAIYTETNMSWSLRSSQLHKAGRKPTILYRKSMGTSS